MIRQKDNNKTNNKEMLKSFYRIGQKDIEKSNDNKSVGNVGIGQEFPSSKLEVSGGDIHVSDADNGLILTSSNGSCFRLRVTDAGSLSVDPISCP